MSKPVKTSMETVEISIDQIEPSPYQPRLAFNLEDIRGSIQRDGILVPLTVRKKNGYYELIDGERRVRLAKELGYKTVPCTVIDVGDETARRMVWKVNTLRQEYTPKEKAYYFRTLQREYGMSLRGIARECDYAEDTVVAHLNVLKLPEKYQNLIWDGPLSVSHVQELRPWFNEGAMDIAHVIEWLDQVIAQKLTSKELREAISPELREAEEKRVKVAREAVPEIVPEAKIPETPEEFEEAAKALREEAKRRKSPKQILEEKRKKARKAVDNMIKRMNEASNLISINEYQKQTEKLEAIIKKDPDKVISELKTLSKQLQADIGKAKEEEMQRRIEEEAKKRARKLEEAERQKIEEEARKRAQEEILTTPELLEEATERAREERYRDFVEMEERAREAAGEIAGPLREALLKAEQDIMDVKSSEKRRLLENYMMIGSVLTTLEKGLIFDIEHEDEEQMLMWKSGTPLNETHRKLKEKLGMN